MDGADVTAKASDSSSVGDTVCIYKSSSAELSESINSMFQWYRQAAICYAYLADLLPDAPLKDCLPSCKWFTRGWTLQELIAPNQVEFYDSKWTMRANKHSITQFIEEITNIRSSVLTLEPDAFSYTSVGEKMSWAARRVTTRIEDRAYCLLGLFNVNMPLLYGEGEKAFQRLQEEILKESDLSLFAWTPPKDMNPYCGLFALSPSFFEGCKISGHGQPLEITITNRAINILSPDTMYSQDPPFLALSVGYRRDRAEPGIVYLRLRYDGDRYWRDNTHGSFAKGLEILSPNMRSIKLPSLSLMTSSQKTRSAWVVRGAWNDIDIKLDDDLRVFRVLPGSSWNPVLSVIHDFPERDSVVVLVGFESQPYESLALVLTASTYGDERFGFGNRGIYAIPRSSPPMPYVLENHSSITADNLQRFWNLQSLTLTKYHVDGNRFRGQNFKASPAPNGLGDFDIHVHINLLDAKDRVSIRVRR